MANVLLNVQIFTLRSKAINASCHLTSKEEDVFFFSGPNPQVLGRDIITILSK